MKRFLLILLTVVFSFTFFTAEMPVTSSVASNASYPNINRQTELIMHGRVGSYYVWLGLNNGDGEGYIIGDINRDVKFASYNRNNGRLILNAYYKNAYIGQYIGTITGRTNNYRYRGTFTNIKGGQVSFDLIDDGTYWD